MKLVIAFALLCVIVVVEAASPDSVDWSRVKALHAEPAALQTVRAENGPPQGRITSGELAAPKQFYYQAGLLLYVEGGMAWCGGTIISDRWIVSAAHCTYMVTTGLDLYLGALNRQDKTEKHQQIIFVAKRYIQTHAGYTPPSLNDDIALIKTPVPIAFNDYIQPAKLPQKADSYSTYVGDMAIASGWGSISDATPGATDWLRFIEAPIMTSRGCSTWFLGSVQSSNICIKTTDRKSTCNGDSGGPLVLADEGNTLIGITSFGIALGCEKGWPAVFTRVTSYLDWIETTMVNN